MEAAIYASAVGLLNSGRPFDGGLFRLLGERRVLQTLVSNGTADAVDAVVDALPARIFNGGSVALLVLAGASALLLILFGLCSFGCAWRTVRRDRSRAGSYASLSALRRRQIQESGQPKSMSCPLALLCLLLLIATLMPMILASSANFRIHHTVTPGADSNENSLPAGVSLVLNKADKFLSGLISQIRAEAAPVLREAQNLTDRVKTRAQTAYEAAFKQSTGAAQLLAVSDELLRRMSDFYNSGKNLSAALETLQAALGDLRNAQFFAYEETCRRYYNGSDDLCSNHSRAAAQLIVAVRDTREDWTVANVSAEDGQGQSSSLESHAKNITKLIYQLVGALDGSGNPPARQQEIRRQKLRIGDEMNANISGVFDRELNSTAFLIESVDSQLRELQGQVDSARESLAQLRGQFSKSYIDLASGPENARFGITLAVLLLFLMCIIALAAGLAPLVLKSMRTGSKTRYFVGTLYLASFSLIALAILLNTAMYIATAILQAEACRYLWDTRSPVNQTKADEFLVPEVNAVLTELRAQAAENPNATKIPITAVDSVLSALQYSCQDNRPMLVALGADRYIDEAALDKTAETVAFQAKGLQILIREMETVNLDQLRDEKLPEDLQNLKPFFRVYTSTDFVQLHRRLRPRAIKAADLEATLESFVRLNKRVHNLLPESESSAKQLSEMNAHNAERCLKAVDYLRRYSNESGAIMVNLEAEKDVNTVIDQVISRSKDLDAYLLNRTLWVETAVQQYQRHVMDGTLEESVRIGKYVGVQFLSSVVRCRSLHEMYAAAVLLPCGLLLQPLSIQCFCIGWLLCCAFVLALITMAGFCRSRVWLTGIAALSRVESIFIGPEAEQLQPTAANELEAVADANGNGNGHRTGSQLSNESTSETHV